MNFPLSLGDISLLLAIVAMALLITSELLSPYYGKVNILISRKRLKNVSLTISILFLTTAAMRIISIIFNP